MLRFLSPVIVFVILIDFFYVKEICGDETQGAIFLKGYTGIEESNTVEKARAIEYLNEYFTESSTEEYIFEPAEKGYSESQLRRFETIFFISLPAGVILTLAGIGAFRAGSGLKGSLKSIEYQYLILSACGISFTIALKDNRIVYRKSNFRLEFEKRQ